MTKIISIILLILLLGCNNIVPIEKEYNEKEEFINIINSFNYNKTQEYSQKCIENEKKGDTLYTISFKYYTELKFEESINNCYYARDYFLDASYDCMTTSKYYNLLSNITTNDMSLYFDYMSKMYEINSISNDYMYEVCEYLETACDFYNNEQYERGHIQINESNKKLKLHDNNVLLYKNYYSESQLLKDKIINSVEDK